MTALTEFQRLEAQGSWRETPEARLREVVVSVGDATLILTDPKSEIPLAHWSLPSVYRLNPGKSPAIYSPQAEGPDETLEIDDPLMIQAIERIDRAIATHRAHPGRLRGGLFLFAALAMIVAVAIWLPDALVRHSAKIAPPAQARGIGNAVLDDITRSTGAVCSRSSGQAVLDWLAPQLLSEDAVIRVVPSPVNGARRLPGDVYVMGTDLLLTRSGPEAAAGHLIAAKMSTDDHGLRLQALEFAGPRAALRLLTLGDLPNEAMKGYGEALLSEQTKPPANEPLLKAFAEKNISSQPYALTLDPTGASVLELVEGDPMRNAPPTRPLLTEEQWLALQQICAG